MENTRPFAGYFDAMIEFYDEKPICNYLAPLFFCPKKLIYILPDGENLHRMKNQVLRFFRYREFVCQIDFISADLNTREGVEDALKQALSVHPGACLDITGGNDFTLFSAGGYCRELSLPVIAYHKRTNAFSPVAGCPFEGDIPCDIRLTAEDFVEMSGGSVVKSGRMTGETASHLFDIIEPIFRLTLRSRGAWASQVQYFQSVFSSAGEGVYRDLRAPMVIRGGRSGSARCNPRLMEELLAIGALTEWREEQEVARFSFRDRQTAEALCDVGMWLELFVYRGALQSGFFDDVRISCIVDWNGVENEPANVLNELDVVVSRKVTPCFISCKSGVPTTAALNELHALTNLLGGRNARAILATGARLPQESPSVYQRAKEMGIGIISRVELETGQLEVCLEELTR